MMSDETAIKVENLSKIFRLPHERSSSLKNLVVNFRRRPKGYELQKALDGVSFDIKQGEFFGIVGRNGSGKSTLLKMLAGIYTPSQGSVQVNGKLTPFIELGVGFNPELTGRENVYLNGALLGFNRKEMSSMYSEIVEFAELERFMDQKLKNYSSGMQVRLAFSIAIRAKGDILLLDEVLAVGDALFQKKCYDYFKELKRQKKTVVFVSHDSGALLEYCTKGILLEKGEIIHTGKIDKIVKEYSDILNRTEQHNYEDGKPKERWGSGKAEILSANLIKEDKMLRVFDDTHPIKLEVEFVAKQDLPSPVCGITISDLSGQIIFQSNTLWCKKPLRDIKNNEKVTLFWEIPNSFNTGKYTVSPAVSDVSGVEVFDWREDMLQFEVNKEQKSHGIINESHKLVAHYGRKQIDGS